MDTGAFFGGMANKAVETQDTQDAEAFKLKLLSAQIEGQIKEHQAASDYDAASTAATQDMSGGAEPIGSRANKQTQDWWKSSEGQANKYAIAQLKLEQARGTNKSHMIDTGNGFVNFITGPDGRMVGQETLAGSPAMMKKAREANKDFGAADSIITLIENGTKQLQLANSFPDSVAHGAKLSLNQYSKNDPNAAAFMATIVPHAQRLEKLLIGTGRLTDQQIAAMQKSLPSEYDTLPVAMDKVRNLRSLFEATRDSSIKAYLGPMQDIHQASDAASSSPDAVAKRFEVYKAKKAAEEAAKKGKN